MTLTLVVAAAAGTVLIIVAERLRLPSIALLLLGGVLLGPEVAGVVHPESLGHGLETVIGLAVAIILFEGGLTLDVRGYRRVPRVIQRMLTVGVVITWLGMAAAVKLVLGWSFPMALLAGSLVIVTGPTVISPLLRRMRLQERLHHALYWEGVLIDAVGVFVAVLCFQFVTGPQGDIVQPMVALLLRVLLGAGLGIVTGMIISTALARHWIEEAHANIFTLALVMLVFGVSNEIMAESGILAVVVAGFVVATRSSTHLKKMKVFKLELTEMAIGLLFILLSAKLDLHHFAELGWDLALIVGAALFIVRPLNILASTAGLNFTRNEKVFLSWLAPRGIVAASMASLFAYRLEALGYPEAIHLETITYAVIATTVIIQGFTAPRIAKALKLTQSSRKTWLLIGAPALAGGIVRGLRRAGVRAMTRAMGTDDDGSSSSVALSVSPPDDDMDDPRLAEVDWMLAACEDVADSGAATRLWESRLGREHTLMWTSEHGATGVERAGTLAFGGLPSASDVAHGLETGNLEIAVLATEPGVEEPGRFGRDLRPLFWVDHQLATPVANPVDPGPPVADQVVVLKRRIEGLAGLISDVVIIRQPEPSMRAVVFRLLEVLASERPYLPIDEVVEGILAREATMSAAVGGGVAIPHAYTDAVHRSRCYLAVLPDGLGTTGPDDAPIQFVALVLSPPDQPAMHLASLGALVNLLGDPGFCKLLLAQRTPEQISRLVEEHA